MLDNGICLTSGEHKYIAHREGRKELFRKKVIEVRGWDIYDQFDSARKSKYIPELIDMKLFLTARLNEIKEMQNDSENIS